MIDNTKLEYIKIELQKLIPIKEETLNVMTQACALLNELIDSEKLHEKLIVVGGLSVEVYTQSDYTTRDLDLVTTSSISFTEALLKVGFQKSERIYYHEELEIAIDVVSSELYGDYNKVIQYLVEGLDGEERTIYLISIEDIILDRLDGSDHEDNRYWGLELLTRYYSEVDMSYIKREVLTKHPNTRNMFDKWIQAIENSKES